MPVSFPEGETKVQVSELKRARRRTLGLAWVVLGFFGGLVLWWASVTFRNLPDQVERPQARSSEAASTAGPRPATRQVVVRDEARVWLFLSRGGRITVDGRPLGKGPQDRVDLAPGAHILIAEIGKARISKQLQVVAGDEVMVDFQEETGRAELRRLVPFAH